MAIKEASSNGLTRRQALFGAGAAAASALIAGSLVGCGGSNSVNSKSTAEEVEVAADKSEGMLQPNVERRQTGFRGDAEQAGLLGGESAAQCAAFTVTAKTREDLIQLLKDWTVAAENMCQGYPTNDPNTNGEASPDDTGEAYDLGAADLKITFGFGASLFEDEKGKDRFGLKAIKPERLIHKMRKMPGDYLVESQCGGDIYICCASNDSQVSWHAMHQMIKKGYGAAKVKWNRIGFLSAEAPGKTDHAPRDPFGFRDGSTNDAILADEELMKKCCWIQEEDNGNDVFANGGTYIMFRIFAGKLESWDLQTLNEQERVIGRRKLDGVPLSHLNDPNADEFTEPDLSATDEDGNSLIDPRSHVSTLRGVRNDTGHAMVRWGWNYTDGIDEFGHMKAGMITGGLSRDPDADFMKFLDAFRDCDLTDYLQYTASAVFIAPHAVRENQEYIGQDMFEATA